MVNRMMISMAVLAVFAAAPLGISAPTCILSNARSEKACQPGSCANKTCCATSSKHTGTDAQPLAKTSFSPQLDLAGTVTTLATAPSEASLGRQFSVPRAPSCALAPQLAVLCTFLI
jgi:hypothetical protein